MQRDKFDEILREITINIKREVSLITFSKDLFSLRDSLESLFDYIQDELQEVDNIIRIEEEDEEYEKE